MQFVNGRSGTPSAWITFKPYPGEHVVIDGTGLTLTSPQSLVEIYQCDYIDFEGFEIRNAEMSGIGACLYVTNDDALHQGYILKDLTIHDCYGTGMLLSQYMGGTPTTQMVNVTVDHSVVHDVDTGADFDDRYSNPAISCTAIADAEIKGCLVYNVGMQYATWTGQEGIVVRIGSTNVTIHDNEIYNTRSGIYLQSQAVSMSDIAVYGNRLHDNFDWGIVLGSEGATPYAMTGVEISDNLIYSNATTIGHSGSTALESGNGGIGVMTYSFDKSFNVINNTLYGNGSKQEMAVLEAGVYQTDCVIRNNIIVGTGNTNYIRYADYPVGISIDHNLFYNTTHGTGSYTPDVGEIRMGTDYVPCDPLLVDPLDDFALRSGSPAVDTGSSLLAPEADYAGTPRPQGSGYDIGAYELCEEACAVPDAGAAGAGGTGVGGYAAGGAGQGGTGAGSGAAAPTSADDQGGGCGCRSPAKSPAPGWGWLAAFGGLGCALIRRRGQPATGVRPVDAVARLGAWKRAECPPGRCVGQLAEGLLGAPPPRDQPRPAASPNDTGAGRGQPDYV